MTWTRYAIMALLALAAASAWRFRDAAWLQDFLHPQPTRKLKIEFDNGTVRQYEAPSPDQAKKAKGPLPVGVLRKCVRGAEVSYTNSYCPPGSQELQVNKGTVTVLGALPRPAPAPAAASAAGLLGQSTAEPTLRQKALDRALNQ